MKNVLIQSLFLLMMGFFLTGATGCNTVDGAGEDIERAGEAVQDAAD